MTIGMCLLVWGGGGVPLEDCTSLKDGELAVGPAQGQAVCYCRGAA